MLREAWPTVLFVVVVITLSLGRTTGQLEFGFYNNSCSMAESVAKATIDASLATDPTAPAALLRLVFHDCRVQGCDASIMLDSTADMTSEMVSDSNFGVRRFEFIDRVKGVLESICPNTVSCADIIAMAGRDAVSFTGGPVFPILLGRRDATTGSNLRADALLPKVSVSVDGFIDVFKSFGMNLEESVAILGAHTIGVGHCVSVQNRLSESDPQLGLIFGGQLRASCLTSSLTNLTIIPTDLTNLVFDNQYYQDVMNGRGLFTIDSELGQDPRTAGIVAGFAGDENSFYQAFSSAFLKLTSANVLTGNQGEIRTNCHFRNNQ